MLPTLTQVPWLPLGNSGRTELLASPGPCPPLAIRQRRQKAPAPSPLSGPVQASHLPQTFLRQNPRVLACCRLPDFTSQALHKPCAQRWPESRRMQEDQGIIKRLPHRLELTGRRLSRQASLEKSDPNTGKGADGSEPSGRGGGVCPLSSPLCPHLFPGSVC